MISLKHVSFETFRMTDHARRMIGHALTLAILLCISGCVSRTPEVTETQPLFHPYGFTHGTFRFEHTDGSRGFDVLYIDSAGINEARHSDFEEIDTKAFTQVHMLTIKHGANVYVIDSTKQVAFHLVDKDLQALYGADTANSWDHQVQSMMRQTGYKLVGDTSFAGVNARHWYQADQVLDLYEWKGLIIGRKSSGPNETHNFILLSADTVTPVSQSQFIVPHGYPIVDRTPR